MSMRRRMEAGINQASSFSLRDCVSEKNVSNQAIGSTLTQPSDQKAVSTVSAVSPIKLSNDKSNASTKFSFNLDQLDKTKCGIKTVGVANAVASQVNGLTQGKPVNASSGFGIPVQQLKHNPNIGLNPEIMRLSAQRDDLRTRLKSTSDKATFLETQLTRLQKLALNERTEFSKQLSLARNEIGNLRDSETKLKSQLTKLNSVAEQKTAFDIAVKTALQSKEVVEMQAKYDELKNNHEAMTLQVQELEEKRSTLVSEIQTAQDSSTEKQSELEESITSLNAQIEAANTKIFELNEESSDVQSKIEEKSSDLEDAEAQLAEIEESFQAKNDELTALESKVDALASKLDEYEEKKDECEKRCCALKIQSSYHQKQIRAAKSELGVKLVEIANAQVPSESPVPPKIEIRFYGDDAPIDGMLGYCTNSPHKQVDEMSDYANGLPYHFEIDAPIYLTGNSTHMMSDSSESISGSSDEDGPNSNSQAMLSAIVGDLRGHLMQASVENEKRGLNRGSATGESPLSVCVE